MLKIINPANGAALKELDEDNSLTLRTKFESARIAQQKWAQVSLDTRKNAISRFRQLLERDRERLAMILTSEVGKPISQSRNEVKGVLGRIDFFLENAQSVMAEEVVGTPNSGIDEKITHEPLGVIANISAWNYPYFVGANVFIPALLTGNAVLYKPSEFSTLTGLAIGELLHEAGIPGDAFQVIVGGGTVGAKLLEEPLRGVFFTGSVATGKIIAQTAAKKLMRVQLELGGKDPAYICDDIDLKRAAASTADGAFYNTGQSCCSVERIYVQANIYEAFLEAFLSEVNGFKVGDPTSESTYIGPLTRATQIPYLEDQIKDALKKGAKLLTGGKRMNGLGNYFEPTVLTGVDSTMAVMREESFGPIIGIQKVADDKEAVRQMLDTHYGLTAGVYTKDKKRAEAILSQMNSGSVYWNCCDRVSPPLPWSGRGDSGMGCTLSKYGIQAFLQPKAWHLRHSL